MDPSLNYNAFPKVISRQLPDEYQNDPQGRDKWHRSHKEVPKDSSKVKGKCKKIQEKSSYKRDGKVNKQLIEKIFSVNSYFYQ